jgi:hypothetical protein
MTPLEPLTVICPRCYKSSVPAFVCDNCLSCCVCCVCDDDEEEDDNDTA